MLTDPPRLPGLDHTLALAGDPYRFVSRRCRAIGADVAQARLLLRPVLLLTGSDAAALFYDTRRFARAGATPEPLRSTLFGHGTVQSLDGAAHARRKRLFVQLLSPASVHRLAQHGELHWQRAALAWRGSGTASLYDRLQQLLTRVACGWAGVPLAEDRVNERSADLAALFGAAADLPFGHWQARRSRRRLEAWLAALVQEARNGATPFAPDSPADALARWREGEWMNPRIAAAELLNLIRPIVAVSVWIVFAAHAMQAHGQPRATEVEAFVQEVRRWYPFIPAVAARVRSDFDWHETRFAAGRLTLLDIYGTAHDPRRWSEPDAFRPQRFVHSEPAPFAFIPQGGGDVEHGHRCPGEAVAVTLTVQALHWLMQMPCELLAPESIPAFGRLPAVPADGVPVLFR